MSSTRVAQLVKAPRSAVYQALLDPNAVVKWKVPTGMTSQVHEFEPREGGFFRISLSYDDPLEKGKSKGHTDTYHGRFAKLIPNEQVVEVIEFETTDPALQGEMTITTTLSERAGGTEVVAIHEHLPSGLAAEANELGWRISLKKLSELVEGVAVQGEW